MVEPDLAELVHDHDRVRQRLVLEEAVQERGLARAEEAGEDGERDRVGTAGHGGLLESASEAIAEGRRRRAALPLLLFGRRWVDAKRRGGRVCTDAADRAHRGCLQAFLPPCGEGGGEADGWGSAGSAGPSKPGEAAAAALQRSRANPARTPTPGPSPQGLIDSHIVLRPLCGPGRAASWRCSARKPSYLLPCRGRWPRRSRDGWGARDARSAKPKRCRAQRRRSRTPGFRCAEQRLRRAPSVPPLRVGPPSPTGKEKGRIDPRRETRASTTDAGDVCID